MTTETLVPAASLKARRLPRWAPWAIGVVSAVIAYLVIYVGGQLRGGVTMQNGLDVSLFVQNLLNKDTLLDGFGDGRGCTPPAGQAQTATCSNYGTYSPFVAQTYEQPRRYGVQLNYKF